MLLFLNIYHQKYFDLLDFIPRFVQTINSQIYYKHYEKDTIPILTVRNNNVVCTKARRTAVYRPDPGLVHG